MARCSAHARVLVVVAAHRYRVVETGESPHDAALNLLNHAKQLIERHRDVILQQGNAAQPIQGRVAECKSSGPA